MRSANMPPLSRIHPSVWSSKLRSIHTSNISEPIKIDFKNGSINKKSKERGRTKPKRKHDTNVTSYNSNNLLKDAYHKIMNDKLLRNSVSFNLNPRNTKQETVNVASQDPNDHPPQLTGELHRILYQPITLHQLKDTRTNVYLFDPKLENITPDLLKKQVLNDENPLFITPHKDKSLMTVANQYNKKYISSTSSMTSIMSHLHYLLSNFRKLNIKNLPISNNFPKEDCTFTRSANFPATVILRKKNNKIRSIDSDRSLDKEIVLSILGHSLEAFLTNPRPPEKEHNEFYHYSKIDDFILRSQLDAYDPKLLGTGIFDLKTRAVSAIRHDLSYVEQNNNYTGYQIDKINGEFESLEREFYELIRSTLLKYSLQARIGKMDGIFVAYHNISKLFGFQYLPLEELDHIIHSSYGPQFEKTLKNRNYDLEKIYGKTEFITNHQRPEKEIAIKVANQEFNLSILLLNNFLRYIEKQINEKVESKNWEKCKIMLKTHQEKIILDNKKVIHYPVLKVIAFPLPDSYEDKSIIPPDATEEVITKEITKYKDKISNQLEDKAFANKIIGFEIRAFHKQKMDDGNGKLPDFVNPKDSSLSKDELDFVMRKLTKSYYPEGMSYQTPNFFNPSDVDLWQTSVCLTPISNKNVLKNLYSDYNNIKLEALEYQSLVGDEDLPVSKVDEIKSRIQSYLNKKKNTKQESEVQKKKSKPTSYQETLRAYANKGTRSQLNKDIVENPNKPIMWNS